MINKVSLVLTLTDNVNRYYLLLL